ncbi:MAG: cytoplasmic protein [Cycloclasticus sp. symbiont of Poecilosclerida sp. M]|nr:MAG: cytoplasmic protein [Cycloclasticus sp. symbiont of Poecilosclerida sp. M]
MIAIKNIEQLAKALSESLPSGLANVKSDVESNFKTLLQQKFSQLNLVSREEFDAQNAVLMRTRHKLEALERTLTELEKTLGQTNLN